jgi:ribosome maturation factor RimP
MATTFEKERTLTEQIVPKVQHDVPGVDVLAVELLSPTRFCVFVDHPEGVDHELCVRVTDALRDYLREYSVEVSSPGVERPLRTREHFAEVVGGQVKVRMIGSKKLKGEVVSAGEDSVIVSAGDGNETHIPYGEIVRANLIHDWSEQ